jgi:hypothetical protein
MTKRVVGVLVLLALITAAVFFAVTQTITTPTIPPSLREKTVEIYDVDDAKTITVNQMDFELKFKRAPPDYSPLGTLINPANGHHVVPLVSCFSCHSKIPMALIKKGEDGATVLKAYRCPQCKGPVYDAAVIDGI